MTTIDLTVRGAVATAVVSGPLTGGMVGVPVSISYDNSWDEMTKTLVCKSVVEDTKIEEVRTIMNVGTQETVAHEVMTAGRMLYLGIEGCNVDGTKVFPTVWACCGRIEPGANADADQTLPATPEAWEQLQIQMGNLEGLNTDEKENLVAAINEAMTKGNGLPGKDGRGVTSVVGNGDGSWTLSFTDNTTETISNEAYRELVEWIGQFYAEIVGKEQLSPQFVNSIEECTDTAKLYVLPDGYVYAYICATQGDTEGSFAWINTGHAFIPADYKIAAPIVCEAGGSEITIGGATEKKLFGLTIYGKTIQSSTPNPDTPVELVSVGDTGKLVVSVTNSDDQAVQNLTIAHTYGLSGIAVASCGNHTDADGQQWICDEIDFENQKYIQRVKAYTLDGDEGWVMSGTEEEGNWRFGLPNSQSFNAGVVMSSHFMLMSSVAAGHAQGGGITCHENGYIEIVQPNCASVDSFKEWLAENPITVMVTYATAVESNLTDEQVAAYHYALLHTAKSDNLIYNDRGADMLVKYVADTKTYIDNATAIVQDSVNGLENKLYSATASGESIKLVDSTHNPLQSLTIYGKNRQETTPTVDSSVALVSPCEGGSLTVIVTGQSDTQLLEIATDNGLWGIPVSSGGNYTDADGQQWICDEIDLKKGVYIQRVVKREISTTNWALNGTVDDGNWRFGHPADINVIQGTVMCSHFPRMSSVAAGHSQGGGINIYANGYIEVVSPIHATLEDFTAWQAENPLTVLMALATPTETSLTVAELGNWAALHLYDGMTTVTNDTGADMVLTYIATKIRIYNDKNVLKRCPMLTFIDDDGSPEAFRNWELIGDAAGITNTFAVVTNRSDGVDWDTVERLQNKGYEFVSHTHNHIDIPATDEATVIEDFKLSIAALKEHGCNSKYLVYPYNSHNADSRALVKQYFRAGIWQGDAVNVPPISPYAICRYSILTDEKQDKELFGETMSVSVPKTLDAFKKIIDECVEECGWVVFMTHLFTNSYGYYCDEELRGLLVEVCKYAAKKGVKISPFGEAFEAYNNRFASGAPIDDAYYIVDCDGESHSA